MVSPRITDDEDDHLLQEICGGDRRPCIANGTHRCETPECGYGDAQVIRRLKAHANALDLRSDVVSINSARTMRHAARRLAELLKKD